MFRECVLEQHYPLQTINVYAQVLKYYWKQIMNSFLAPLLRLPTMILVRILLNPPINFTWPPTGLMVTTSDFY